jgi:hypothetical protein
MRHIGWRRIIWEFFKVMVAAIIAAIVIEILHDDGYYPDRWLLGLIVQSSGALFSPLAYLLLAILIAVPLLFAEHWIGPFLVSWWKKRSKPQDTGVPPSKLAPLQINVGEDGPFSDIPKHGLYGFAQRFKIELCNTDPSKTASQCKVQITKIEPESGYRGPWILAEGLTLASGDQAYIPIVQYGQARQPEITNNADTAIQVCSTGKQPLLQIDKENILTVRATAPDMPFT